MIEISFRNRFNRSIKIIITTVENPSNPQSSTVSPSSRPISIRNPPCIHDTVQRSFFSWWKRGGKGGGGGKRENVKAAVEGERRSERVGENRARGWAAGVEGREGEGGGGLERSGVEDTSAKAKLG